MLEMICMACATPSCRAPAVWKRAKFRTSSADWRRRSKLRREHGRLISEVARLPFLVPSSLTTTASFGLGLNGLDERCDFFRGAAGVLSELGLRRRRRRNRGRPHQRGGFDGGVERNKLVCSVMSLMTLMISEISSERIAKDLIFWRWLARKHGMRCMPSRVSGGAVTLLGVVGERVVRLRRWLGVVGNLFHRNGELFTALDVLVISWSLVSGASCISSAATRMLLEQAVTSIAACGRAREPW